MLIPHWRRNRRFHTASALREIPRRYALSGWHIAEDFALLDNIYIIAFIYAHNERSSFDESQYWIPEYLAKVLQGMFVKAPKNRKSTRVKSYTFNDVDYYY